MDISYENYKNLLEKIIDHYINQETLSNAVFRYVLHTTADDNLTKFEKLSINNQIGVYTNLCDIDSKIILMILQMLFSRNYFRINDRIFIEEILDDHDINPEQFDVLKMFSNLANGNYDDTSKWIEYFELSVSDIEDEFNDNEQKLNYVEEYGTFINELKIFNLKPDVFKHFNIRFEQKFYKLEELKQFF